MFVQRKQLYKLTGCEIAIDYRFIIYYDFFTDFL